MSRLECKDIVTGVSLCTFNIRICPDWNVKVSILDQIAVADFIRICPDWNVKQIYFYPKEGKKPLEYVQIGM